MNLHRDMELLMGRSRLLLKIRKVLHLNHDRSRSEEIYSRRVIGARGAPCGLDSCNRKINITLSN